MAISNYDTVPRFAGVSVATTGGKFAPKSDGTNALALYTVAVDVNGTPVSGGSGNTAAQTQPALRTTKALTSAVVNASSSGDNTLVAAVSGQTTRIHRLVLVSAGTVSITFKNGAGTALTGAMPLVANQGLVLDLSSEPWFITSANTAFILGLSGAIGVTGWIEYVTSA